MKLTFLGTGTSAGVPMIGCRCAVCRSEDPRNRRYRTHAHLSIGGLSILIDAAQEFRLQAIKHRIDFLDMMLLTHGHADHILGCDDLRRYCDGKAGGALPVYGNEEGLERLRAIYPYAIRERPEVRGYPAFRPLPMPRELALGSAGVARSTTQSHGPFETLGLVFEESGTGARLAYFTDCDSVSEEAVALARGAAVAVIDALRPQPHMSHMSIAQALEAAERIGARQTYFIHMTHDIDHDVVDTALPDGVNLAYDDLVVEVGRHS